MQNRDQMIEHIRALCLRALEGDIDLCDFFRAWPKEANSDPFLTVLRDDLEDGVEHTPGEHYGGKVDFEEWHSMSEYYDIYLGWVLLGYNRPSVELLKCRERVLKLKSPSTEQIDSFVVEYFRLLADENISGQQDRTIDE